MLLSLGMKIASISLVFAIALVIILSNFLILTFSQNYRTVDKARTNEVLEYFRGKNNLEDNYFSMQAKAHLIDVRKLFSIAIVVNYISIVVACLLSIILITRKQIRIIHKSIVTGSILSIYFVVVLITLSLINFDFFFIKFHQLIFRNNNWLFNPNDNLVKLFPERFFIAFVRQHITNIFITGITLIIFTKLLTGHAKSSN